MPILKKSPMTVQAPKIQVPTVYNQATSAARTMATQTTGATTPSYQTNTTIQPVNAPKPTPMQAYNPYQVNGATQQLQARLRDSYLKTNDYNLQKQKDYDASIIGQASPYINAASSVVNTVASVASIYAGLENLSLAKKADKRAEATFQAQMGELKRLQKVIADNDARMAKFEKNPNSIYYQG